MRPVDRGQGIGDALVVIRALSEHVSPQGRKRRNAVKTIVTALGIASLVALAACDSKQENKVENAYENQADAIDNQADNMEGMADNLSGGAENAAENAADALENQADAVREAGEKAGDAVEKKGN
jgi:uncharacterized protein YjbJ (UPF0337 family)